MTDRLRLEATEYRNYWQLYRGDHPTDVSVKIVVGGSLSVSEAMEVELHIVNAVNSPSELKAENARLRNEVNRVQCANASLRRENDRMREDLYLAEDEKGSMDSHIVDLMLRLDAALDERDGLQKKRGTDE